MWKCGKTSYDTIWHPSSFISNRWRVRKLLRKSGSVRTMWSRYLGCCSYNTLEQPIQHRVVDQSFKQNQRISGVIRYGLGSDQLPVLQPGPLLARDWQGEDVPEVEDNVIEKEESYDSRKESELPPTRWTIWPAKPSTFDSGDKREFKWPSTHLYDSRTGSDIVLFNDIHGVGLPVPIFDFRHWSS